MIKPLLVNAATLIAALFILGQHFVNTPLNHNSPRRVRLIAGIFTGIVGSLLVVLGVRVTKTVMVDFRYISLIVASIYGGPLTTAIGAIIIAIFRVFYIGLSYASVVACVFVFSAALGCGIISKLRIGNKKKWVYMIIYCLVNSFFALYFVIDKYPKLLRVFVPYSFVFSLIAFLVYYYSEAIALSNTLVRNLKKESSKDFLTGLNNVRNFDKLYNTALQEAQESFEKLSVVVVDIDFFKRVNDTYGHQAGDAILKQLGEILVQGCRVFDIVSRNGGEEFSIILKCCSGDKAYEIAERIRIRVESYKFILPNNKQINITISVGIATYPDTAENNESLYKNADKALYKAKNSGRNRVCYYTGKSSIYCGKEEDVIS